MGQFLRVDVGIDPYKKAGDEAPRRHYRAAARTRAPKQPTGLFFSLRSCPVRASARNHSKNKNTTLSGGVLFLERATRLELATSTLARSRSTR